MEQSQNKKFAPLYLFLVLFALCIGALFFITRSSSRSASQTFKETNLLAPHAKKDATWQQEKDLAQMVERGGHMVQTLMDGTTITYTIDPALQLFVTGELKKYEIPYGAAVMVDLPSGKVRVMAGYSKENPKLTHGELVLKAWAPAASLIKVVTASILLEGGKINPTQPVCYNGGKQGLKPFHFTDDPQKDTQCEDLYSALGNSNNAVFGKLSQRHITREQYLEMGNRLGFNRTLPFAFPVDKSSLIISTSSKYAVGYTGAGFGNATLSPFHAAWLMATIASGGISRELRIIRSVRDPRGKPIFRPTKEAGENKTLLNATTVQQLTAMLRKTVSEGTAREAFFSKSDTELLSFPTVGKTGTLSRNEPHYLQYTWFAGFAPQTNPRVAFAIIIVNPAKWRTKATYMAQRLLLRYFSRFSAKTPAMGPSS
ncbi:hypothetical protein KKF84_01505 [Myxococcota bacterium]|nr:hypothetical protein [Myxococcota bacterium]MBU1533961.1 hypothetical protein [Myxococcota bacterium]